MKWFPFEPPSELFPSWWILLTSNKLGVDGKWSGIECTVSHHHGFTILCVNEGHLWIMHCCNQPPLHSNQTLSPWTGTYQSVRLAWHRRWPDRGHLDPYDPTNKVIEESVSSNYCEMDPRSTDSSHRTRCNGNNRLRNNLRRLFIELRIQPKEEFHLPDTMVVINSNTAVCHRADWNIFESMLIWLSSFGILFLLPTFPSVDLSRVIHSPRMPLFQWRWSLNFSFMCFTI